MRKPTAYITRQGNTLVARDPEGKLIVEKCGNVEVVRMRPLTQSRRYSRQTGDYEMKTTKRTLRQAFKDLSADGTDMYVNLYNLALGKPVVPQLPDGRLGEPMVPTPEVMRAATVNFIEFMDGKAVARTEVLAAEREELDLAKFDAISNDTLERIAAGDEEPAQLLDANETEGVESEESID